MRFRPIYASREHRYALERDGETGDPVLSIPVSNTLMDYTEWYVISESELDGFLSDEPSAQAFAKQCGNHEHDDRLVLKPGTDRGVY